MTLKWRQVAAGCNSLYEIRVVAAKLQAGAANSSQTGALWQATTVKNLLSNAQFENYARWDTIPSPSLKSPHWLKKHQAKSTLNRSFEWRISDRAFYSALDEQLWPEELSWMKEAAYEEAEEYFALQEAHSQTYGEDFWESSPNTLAGTTSMCDFSICQTDEDEAAWLQIMAGDYSPLIGRNIFKKSRFEIERERKTERWIHFIQLFLSSLLLEEKLQTRFNSLKRIFSKIFKPTLTCLGYYQRRTCPPLMVAAPPTNI